MRRLILLATAGAALSNADAAAAHNFWIEPQSFQVSPGAVAPLVLQVGQGADAQRSRLPERRVTRFEALGPQGRETIVTHFGGETADADLRAAGAGVHVTALETDDAVLSFLPAERFNAYLLAEGLTPAIEARRRSGRTGADGSERYRRVAKALLQAGAPRGGPQEAATKPLGLELEIVPEVSPYASQAPAELTIRVFYHGRPLPGAHVTLARLGAAEAESHLTDPAGRATFAAPRTGRWRFATAWTRPTGDPDGPDFATVFSSLTFGFEEGGYEEGAP